MEMHEDERPDAEPTSFETEDDDLPEAVPTGWAAAKEIVGALIALLLVTLVVMVIYLAGGIAFGVLDYLFRTAAPAILAIVAAILLARYLSRR